MNLIVGQEPLAEVMREVSALVDAHGFDRTEVAKRMALSMAGDGYTVAPGAWLAGQLMAGFGRDLGRKPLRSDSIDCLHAMHYPYVDIATCDAQAHGILSPLLPKARGSRLAPVTLFRNNRLKELVAYISTLPTGADLYANRD